MVRRSMSARNAAQVSPMQTSLGLFDGIPASFQACGARSAKCGLLLLRGCLLLLLGLLSGGCILAPALSARGSRANRSAGARISADDLAHHRAARCTAQACAGGRAGCCRWRCRDGLLRWWFCRIVARLLYCPRTAGGLVTFLLLRRLPLRWINELLGDRCGKQRRSQCKCPKSIPFHSATRFRKNRVLILSSPSTRPSSLTAKKGIKATKMTREPASSS